MISAEDKTILGPSIRFKGELSGADDLVLLGDFEGSIELSAARLTIGPGAHIRASIAAKDVTVMGRVEGEIRSAGSVSLRASSVVLGNVFASRLSIEPEAVLRGQVDPARAGEPFAPKAQMPSEAPPEIRGIQARSPEASSSQRVPSFPNIPQPVPPAPVTFASGLAPAGGEVSRTPGNPANPSSEMPAGLAAAARHIGGNPTGDRGAALKQPAVVAETKVR